MDEDIVRRHAYQLWEAAGRPAGRDSEFWEKGKELAAIEQNQGLATKPRRGADGPWDEPVERGERIGGQGDVPGLTDQGNDQARPPHYGDNR